MSAVFNEAFEQTMGHEGGYSNDPDDPGGETYWGISRVHHPSWGGWRKIDAGQRENPFLYTAVKEFYWKEYWKKLHCDWFHPAIGAELFDSGVNVGKNAAVIFLQHSLNLLNQNEKWYENILMDGSVGPQTRKAYDSLPKKYLPALLKVQNICQGAYYIDLMDSDERREKWIGWFGRVSL